jgi:hypothetical protein
MKSLRPVDSFIPPSACNIICVTGPINASRNEYAQEIASQLSQGDEIPCITPEVHEIVIGDNKVAITFSHQPTSSKQEIANHLLYCKIRDVISQGHSTIILSCSEDFINCIYLTLYGYFNRIITLFHVKYDISDEADLLNIVFSPKFTHLIARNNVKKNDTLAYRTYLWRRETAHAVIDELKLIVPTKKPIVPQIIRINGLRALATFKINDRFFYGFIKLSDEVKYIDPPNTILLDNKDFHAKCTGKVIYLRHKGVRVVKFAIILLEDCEFVRLIKQKYNKKHVFIIVSNSIIMATHGEKFANAAIDAMNNKEQNFKYTINNYTIEYTIEQSNDQSEVIEISTHGIF